MKKHFLIMLLISQLALLTKIYAQNIAINGNGNQPDTSAMLDVSSTNKGFLAPRMTTAQQNAIPLPANGLLIFNTTDNVFKVNTGTSGAPVWTPLALGSGAITNSLGSSINTITSTVNGMVATAPLINSVSNNSAANTLTTTVNGVAGTGVSIVNSNALTNPVNTITSTINGVTATAAAVNTAALSLSGSTLTSTVNGVSSTGLNLSPAVAAATTNTMSSSVNTLTNTTNGVSATAPIVNSVSNTSSANNLTTTVNGVAATAVPMINTNALSISGSNVTSTINGVASNALTLPFLTTLNTLTGASQTFATGSTGANFAISSSGTTHTFNLPDAAAAARGVVSTGTQTFAGNKTFSGTVTASLPSGATTDSLVTADPTGLLRKRTIASVVAGNVWGTFGNSPVNSGNMFFGSVNNASLRFRSNNVERMVLDSVGNVGFGIAVPLKPIDIVCNLPALGGVMQFRNSAANGYTSIDLQNEAGTQVGNIGWGNTLAAAPYSNSFYFSSNVSAPMLFLTTSTERMRILAGGNIGIGTTTPTSLLEVEGAFATNIYKSVNTSAVTLDNTAAVWYFTHAASSINLPTASTCTNRRYIIVNRSGSARTTSSYTSLSTTGVTSIANNSSIEIISDGTTWLQIK